MILSHITFEKPIEILEETISVLKVENQRQLSAYVAELKQQSEGDMGRFILSDNGKEIEISQKVCLVTDIFSMNPNDRGTLNKLYVKMNAESHDENNYDGTSEFLSHAERFLLNIAKQQPFPITFSENLDLVGIFKLANVHFILSDDSMLERVCDFMTINANYVRPRLFIFVNLKCFLSKDDIEQLYHFVLYNKHRLLLIEGTSSDAMPFEKTRIIDADLCEIDIGGDIINYSKNI